MQVGHIQEQQDIRTTEAAQLNKEAEKLSAPSTFAQSAKLSRRAVALEKEIAALEQAKVSLPLIHGIRHAGGDMYIVTYMADLRPFSSCMLKAPKSSPIRPECPCR